MTKLRTFWPVSVLILAMFGIHNRTFPQYSFSDPDPTCCEDDEAVTLAEVPSGGVFGVPGMTGNVFDPALAGHGVHTIQYELSETGDQFYLRTIGGVPWGGAPDIDAMHDTFDPGWTLAEF